MFISERSTYRLKNKDKLRLCPLIDKQSYRDTATPYEEGIKMHKDNDWKMPPSGSEKNRREVSMIKSWLKFGIKKSSSATFFMLLVLLSMAFVPVVSAHRADKNQASQI